jgi:hypothetical protein
MKKVWIFSLFAGLLSGSVACKKSVDEDKLINDFLTSKSWTAQRTDEGVYYIIDAQGTGSTTYWMGLFLTKTKLLRALRHPFVALFKAGKLVCQNSKKVVKANCSFLRL